MMRDFLDIAATMYISFVAGFFIGKLFNVLIRRRG